MKNVFLDFNPVADFQFSAPPRFQYAVYFDHAIQDEEFCFYAVLGNIGKFKKLGKTDGLGADGNFWHVSFAGGLRKKAARDSLLAPGSWLLFTFVKTVCFFSKLQNLDGLLQQFTGLLGFSGTH